VQQQQERRSIAGPAGLLRPAHPMHQRELRPRPVCHGRRAARSTAGPDHVSSRLKCSYRMTFDGVQSGGANRLVAPLDFIAITVRTP